MPKVPCDLHKFYRQPYRPFTFHQKSSLNYYYHLYKQQKPGKQDITKCKDIMYYSLYLIKLIQHSYSVSLCTYIMPLLSN